MRYTCALCGKPTTPAAMIGTMAVGPKCARKAGLTSKKLPKGSAVRILTPARKPKAGTPYTLDLFDHEPDATLAPQRTEP